MLPRSCWQTATASRCARWMRQASRWMQQAFPCRGTRPMPPFLSCRPAASMVENLVFNTWKLPRVEAWQLPSRVDPSLPLPLAVPLCLTLHAMERLQYASSSSPSLPLSPRRFRRSPSRPSRSLGFISSPLSEHRARWVYYSTTHRAVLHSLLACWVHRLECTQCLSTQLNPVHSHALSTQCTAVKRHSKEHDAPPLPLLNLLSLSLVRLHRTLNRLQSRYIVLPPLPCTRVTSAVGLTGKGA